MANRYSSGADEEDFVENDGQSSEQMTVPVDALLIRGGCVVNEAMLTGACVCVCVSVCVCLCV